MRTPLCDDNLQVVTCEFDESCLPIFSVHRGLGRQFVDHLHADIRVCVHVHQYVHLRPTRCLRGQDRATSSLYPAASEKVPRLRLAAIDVPSVGHVDKAINATVPVEVPSTVHIDRAVRISISDKVTSVENTDPALDTPISDDCNIALMTSLIPSLPIGKATHASRVTRARP
ncbi:uncharacterized protein LAESUDRAFT_195335 [Laetiporus sulphureus 93-53]|uniref:Uncharacterized protein n=1 Tax=Laetiporus sulphureus 93-53 TaxID=1314785 RepID=A0A165E176_9APHY|nr:uncharacterized protein LAESUDRAFT_195335 [Laetiporus sulphureus 93-53]KZT06051.1 hypothetical protein LAESUDRAFT_195335 [Laetiporus sulphureus 93-53]